MTVFWLTGAAMVAVALAFVIPPLLRSTRARDPSRRQANVNIYQERLGELELQAASGTLDSAQFARAREELDREMLTQLGESAAEQEQIEQPRDAQPLRAIALAVCLPLLAVGIYLQVGSPRLLFDTPAPAAVSAAADDTAQPSVEQMIAQLQQRLQTEPDDIRGWLMLGRSYSVMGRNEDARTALAQAYERAPDDPDVMLSYAQVLTTLNKGSLAGEPIALVKRVLAIDGDRPSALWLAGIHALNQGIPSQALAAWQKILDSAKLDAAASTQVRKAMDTVRSTVADVRGSARSDSQAVSAANDAPRAQGEARAAAGAAAGTGKAAVRVNVSLAPELRASITGTETVFVFARASEGPPMPLAVQRLAANQLPLTVVLDDSNAMTPELAISRFDTVVVTARVSRSGTPTAAPGDLQGISARVATRAAMPVDLLIDQRLE